MLPNSSLEFFVISACGFLFLLLCKCFLSNTINFSTAILALSSVFITIYFPKPVHAGLFVLYGYAIYYIIIHLLKSEKKWIGIVLLLLPMIIIKAKLLDDIIAFAGLSFITFRMLQVFLDADTRLKPINILDYVSFLIFIPTILIGPIDRFNRFKSDLSVGYSAINISTFIVGWEILMLGLLQKFVVAEAINRFLLSNIDVDSTQAADVLSYIYTYAFYLYFDFAGYSSLAVGLSKIFGINTPENFNNPFIAQNPQDFWRRWHISLSEWLRDYFFKPYYKWVSGLKPMKKFPLLKQNIGLFFTFIIMGVWNGFMNYYLISGALFGIYSVVHNSYVYSCKKNNRDVIFGNLNPKVVKYISVFIMFNLVCIALYAFSGNCIYL